MADKGWIKLHRIITENEIWNDKPYDRSHAWVDILLMVNHEGKKFLLGNEMVYVERGSTITSEHKLMDRWGWSKTKVRSFLHLLEIEKMIIKKSDSKKTTLSVLNYSVYQDKETTEEPERDQKKTAKRPQKDPNKNEKNEKNLINKITFGEFVLLTEDEHAKLVERFGADATQWMIEKLDNAIGANGYKYKSHYRAILNWVKDDYNKAHKDKSKGPDNQKEPKAKSDKYENFYL